MKRINALIVPTGIGASIGGFAGDANPAAKLLAKVSDYLITHPNVVNGSVLTKIPANVLVLEGALMDKFFLEEIAIKPKVKHKIAVICDSDIEKSQKEITQNCVHAAKYFYGIDIIEDIFYTEEPIDCDLERIANEDTLLEACSKALKAGATALALLAKIPDPTDTKESKAYEAGIGLDPIGIIEAKISHLVSAEFLVPSAHAPILEPAFEHEALVHPRVAAEHLGITYLPSVINCLVHSPGIVDLSVNDLKILRSNPDLIYVKDLTNLVVPYDACDAVPMHKALEHGIDLLSIKQNTTVLDKTAESLGLKHQLLNNYLEAAGYLAANTGDSDYVDPSLFQQKE